MKRFYSVVLFSFTIFSFSGSCHAMAGLEYFDTKEDFYDAKEKAAILNKLYPCTKRIYNSEISVDSKGYQPPSKLRELEFFPIKERKGFAKTVHKYVFQLPLDETLNIKNEFDPVFKTRLHEFDCRLPGPEDDPDKLDWLNFKNRGLIFGLRRTMALEKQVRDLLASLISNKGISTADACKKLRGFKKERDRVVEEMPYFVSYGALWFQQEDYKKITDACKYSKKNLNKIIEKAEARLGSSRFPSSPITTRSQTRKKNSGHAIKTKSKKMKNKKKLPKIKLKLNFKKNPYFVSASE